MSDVLDKSSKREQSRREQRHVTADALGYRAKEKLRHGDGGGNSDALKAVFSRRKPVAPKQGRGSTPHSQPVPSDTHENTRDGSALFTLHCTCCGITPCRCAYLPTPSRLAPPLSDADVERIAKRVVELMREEKKR